MTMTRKHFEAIAEILKYNSNKTHPAVFSKMVLDFSELCAKENPNFNVTKFHEASGYQVPSFNSRG
jgi:hypothetical protein